MASRADRAAYLKEVELANSLPPHEHIVSYLRAWQDECILYVQMELCEGGTLREQMATRPLHAPSGDHVVWKLVRQVASALAHIHAAFLIHCDVKPDNVLLDGRATTRWASRPGDRPDLVGRARGRRAVHLGRPPPQQPLPAADIFSFGIMILEVKLVRPSPGTATHGRSCARAARRPSSGACLRDGRPALPSLVLAMMNQNAMERPDARAVEMACPQLVQAGTRSLGSRLLRAAVRGVSAFNMRSRAQRG